MSNCLYCYKFNDNLIYPKMLAEIGKELLIFFYLNEPFIETLHDFGIILEEVSFDLC